MLPCKLKLTCLNDSVVRPVFSVLATNVYTKLHGIFGFLALVIIFLSRVCLSEHLFLHNVIGSLRISHGNGCCCTICDLLVRDFVRFGDLELLDSIVDQRRKGFELYYKGCISIIKIRWNCNWYDFPTIRKAQMWSCGKTRSMSTSHAREMKNDKELTILRLRNVSRKECWTIVYGVETAPLFSIIYGWIHYNNNNNNYIIVIITTTTTTTFMWRHFHLAQWYFTIKKKYKSKSNLLMMSKYVNTWYPVVSYSWIFRTQTIRTQVQTFRKHFRSVRTHLSGRFVPNKLTQNV